MLGSREGGTALGALIVAAGLALTFTTASRPDAASLPTTASNRQVVSGYVNAAVRVGGAVYVGGEFSRIAPRTGSAIIVSKRGGRIEPVRAEIAGGSVNAAVSDGAGGWYVGGSFTAVGDARRNGLAHVLADGTPDPAFVPPDLPEIKAMALDGHVLAVVAAERNAGAVSHALDTRTGAELRVAYARPLGAGDPRVLLANEGTLYIAFGNRRLAAYQIGSGMRLWSRRFGGGTSIRDEGGVIAMAMNGSQLIVGGGFTQGRNQNLVLLDAGSGALERPVVRVPRGVLSLAVVDDTAYVAYARSRRFSSGLAVLDLESGRLRAWGAIRPDLLAADATNVYMTGMSTKDARRSKSFPLNRVYSARAGTPHANLHRVSPPVAGEALALVPQGGHLLFGGTFTGAGGVVRNNLAAFDARTGRLLPWHPNAADGGCCGVKAVAAAGRTIYVAGPFTQVSGAPRDGLAAVSAHGAGQLLPWHPRLSHSSIYELAVGAGRVFAGGSLILPGENQMVGLAAFSARGAATHLRFAPKLGFEFDIGAMTVWHRTLVVGGQSVIAYAAHGDGRHELWRRPTDSYVFAFARRSTTLYAGGNFEHVARRPRRNVAALALNRHGALLPFAPIVPITVETLALSGPDLVFGGGDFDAHSPQVLGAVDLNGKLEPWRFDAPEAIEVDQVAQAGSGLFVAGAFDWLGPPGNQAAGGLAWLR